MQHVILILGALGAWFLVAGPLFQAAVELREQEFDREEMEKATSSVQAPKSISPWWWLLPPVAWSSSADSPRHTDRRSWMPSALVS